MSKLTREQQKQLVRQWGKAGQELERIRKEGLCDLPYRWQDVDTLLALADFHEGPDRMAKGLVEMQRLFMLTPRKDLVPSRWKAES